MEETQKQELSMQNIECSLVCVSFQSLSLYIFYFCFCYFLYEWDPSICIIHDFFSFEITIYHSVSIHIGMLSSLFYRLQNNSVLWIVLPHFLTALLKDIKISNYFLKKFPSSEKGLLGSVLFWLSSASNYPELSYLLYSWQLEHFFVHDAIYML